MDDKPVVSIHFLRARVGTRWAKVVKTYRPLDLPVGKISCTTETTDISWDDMPAVVREEALRTGSSDIKYIQK